MAGWFSFLISAVTFFFPGNYDKMDPDANRDFT
jgi:pimeloyl-ACP methyl ester carboxylesterase